MKFITLVTGIALSLAAAMSFAQAETSQEAKLRKIIQPRIGENAPIDSVTKTPYSGLFEVRVGGDLFYTDAEGKYLFVGRILDAKTTQDLTKARVDEINKIKFADLPLDSALKTVKGNGKRVIAVFEDPNCSYCKKFHQTLSQVDNVTVYTFLYNILSDDSAVKSKNVWCSADRNKAYSDYMLGGKPLATAPDACATPNDKVLELGRRLKVTGTPTIFFQDGTRIPGAMDVKGLESKLATVR